MSSESISRIENALGRLSRLGRITVMTDYFVDRLVRIKNFDELVSLMKKKGETGGGSVRGVNQIEVKGGNAVNIGYTLGIFGANVNMLAIANSLPREMLASIFSKFKNVNLQIIEGKAGYTTAFEFKEKGRHVNVMISDTGDLNSFDGTRLSKQNIESVKHSDIVAVVNWAANKEGNHLCEKVFTLAKKNGVKTFFDPADVSGQNEKLLGLKRSVFDKGLVDYVSLNENEARIVSGVLFKHNLSRAYSSEELKKTAKILSEGIGATVDIHTHTMSVSARGEDLISDNCYHVKQETITGAGDVWGAADLAGYLAKLQDSDRLLFANAAAGLYVSRESAETPPLKEIFGFMKNRRVH
ncbi:MAG: carbohydrate kinase family protein [Nitrososphaerales archaeon]